MKTLACVVLALLASGAALAADPPFANSVVSTDFDFILDSDPSALESVGFVEFARREMPDSRSNRLFGEAYIFEARFADGERVRIWAHEDFGSRDAAEAYVRPLAEAIGRQPGLLRSALHHVVLHQGDATAFAEELAGFFVIYSDNMDTRIGEHDLQETVFHECAHVALERRHAAAPGWLRAQRADPGFITRYAEANPAKEDLPESALFAYVLLNHPGRLPAEVEAAVRERIPGRIAYLEQIEGFVHPEPEPESETDPGR